MTWNRKTWINDDKGLKLASELTEGSLKIMAVEEEIQL